MKTNRGKFVKCKTTTARYFRKTGLRVGSSYYFKVRPYKTYKGKRYYGYFSPVRKITMTSYVYLTDVIKPYASYGYEQYKGSDSVTMAGRKYYHSIKVDDWSGTFAIYNLNGKYSKMTFYFGGIDGSDGDRDISFICDDQTVKTISRKQYSLPKAYSVDIRDTYKFEIRASDFSGWGEREVGFGNVKLYY